MLSLLINALVTYRLAKLLTKEDGIYFRDKQGYLVGMFDWLRTYFGKKASSNNWFWFNLAEIFSCPLCMGVWIAILLVVVGDTYHPIMMVKTILAVAGIQDIIQSFLMKGE